MLKVKQIDFIKYLLTISFIYVFCAPNLIFAQSTYLQHYTTKNGLASNSTFSVLQDKNGFIWIASDGGLSRFDGTNFYNFSVEDGLPDTQILQIKEDKAGKIWFLTLNGQIGYLHNSKFYNQDNEATLKQLNYKTLIVSFLEDRNKNIWFGTNSNLVLKWDGNKVHKYISDSKTHNLTNAYIHQDRHGHIYALNNLSTHVLKNNAFHHTDLKVQPISYKSAFNSVINSLYFLDNEGLKEFGHKEIKTLIKIPQNILKNTEGYFFYDKNADEVWLSTKNGAYVVHSSGKINTFLIGETVNQIIKDDQENMWFATANGLHMLPNSSSRLTIFDKQNGLNTNVIKSITQDDHGKIWLGSDQSIINSIDIKDLKIEHYDLQNDNKFGSIKQIKFDPSNHLIYFASDFGMGYFEDLGTKNLKPKLLKETNNLVFVIKNFSVNAKKQEVAIALSSGVATINSKSLNFNSQQNKESENFFRDRAYFTFYDNSGNIWFSNIWGLNELKNGKIIKHYEVNNLLTKRINDIQQLEDGTFVLATDGYGIIFYKNGKIMHHLTRKDGLLSNICIKMFKKNDELWLITKSGINKIQKLHQKPLVVSFDYGNDLLRDDVNDLYVSDSTAYFATNKGLILLNHSLPTHSKNIPRIYITSISNDGNRLPLNKIHYDFNNNSKVIVFTYTAVDFTTTSIAYRYRLKDKNEWIVTRNRRLDFSSLSPGAYNFEVSARNQNGIWSEPVKVSFTIEKVFWQTYWFIALVILLFGFIFYQLIAYLNKKQRDSEKQKLMVKNKILSLEQQALQAMMNPHFVFNVMNSIQHYINTQNTTSANKILTGFAKLIRKNLEICTKSYISIEEELEYLELYLQLEKNRFGDKLTYTFTIDGEIDKEETFIPSMLLQPYIENAIWHGLMPKEEGGQIDIKISKQKNHFIIAILDNGIGIDNALKMKNKGHESKGMKLTRERLALLGQIEDKAIHLNVFQTGDQGTTGYISIPL